MVRCVWSPVSSTDALGWLCVAHRATLSHPLETQEILVLNCDQRDLLESTSIRRSIVVGDLSSRVRIVVRLALLSA